jgi:hypothetical protein
MLWITKRSFTHTITTYFEMLTVCLELSLTLGDTPCSPGQRKQADLGQYLAADSAVKRVF